LRLLRLVRMIRSGVNLQPLQHFERELILRQHPPHCIAKNPVGMSCESPLRGFRSQAGIARKPGVFLFGPLLTTEVDFLSVNNDDRVTTQDVRRVGRAMLAHQDHGDFARQPADDLIRRIDDVPLFFNLARLGQKRLGARHDKLLAASSGRSALTNSAKNQTMQCTGGPNSPQGAVPPLLDASTPR